MLVVVFVVVVTLPPVKELLQATLHLCSDYMGNGTQKCPKAKGERRKAKGAGSARE